MTIGHAVQSLGEEGFVRRMEELSTADRRDIFLRLAVPKGGASASARQRTRKRILLAWSRLSGSGDEEAAEMFARAWLGRTGMAMIIEFLDRFEVAHEGGYLQDPDVLKKLPATEVGRALAELAERHDEGDVRLYAALMSLPHDGATADAAG